MLIKPGVFPLFPCFLDGFFGKIHVSPFYNLFSYILARGRGRGITNQLKIHQPINPLLLDHIVKIVGWCIHQECHNRVHNVALIYVKKNDEHNASWHTGNISSKHLFDPIKYHPLIHPQNVFENCKLPLEETRKFIDNNSVSWLAFKNEVWWWQVSWCCHHHSKCCPLCNESWLMHVNCSHSFGIQCLFSMHQK